MANSKRDVQGYRDNCFYYDPCPICYGCRNYHVYCVSRCDNRCGDDIHKNVCISKFHTPENFAKIIQRPFIDLDKYYKNKKEEN